MKALLQQILPEPLFYSDLVYIFKGIFGQPTFTDQFKKMIKRYKITWGMA